MVLLGELLAGQKSSRCDGLAEVAPALARRQGPLGVARHQYGIENMKMLAMEPMLV